MSNDALTTDVPTQLAELTIADIHVVPGFNPRRAFRAAPMSRMIDSVREHGVLQPIVVRPADSGSGYDLVVGERRYRASVATNRATIPASIRFCTYEQAKTYAVLENIDRSDISAGEEALAARDMLDLAQGDRDATCSALGWSATKLNARLLLLTASQAVLDALAHDTIHIGHAELLAGLPAESQDKALQRIIDNKVSVADLREQVKGIVIPLARAIFDTADCNGCPFNTATQRSLFGDAVEGSNCKNKACYSEKTSASIEAKRAQLADDVGTVALTTEKDESAYIPLIVTGPGGVGGPQYEQCRTCIHFGALIHSKLDQRLGQVERPICFNRPCHTSKVEVYAEQSAAEPQGDEESASHVPDPSVVPHEKKASASKKAAPKKATKALSKGKKTAAPAASSGAARTVIKPAYVGAAAELLTKDTRVPFALAIMAMAKVLREANVDLPESVVLTGQRPEEVTASLLALDEADVVSRFRLCATAFVQGKHSNPQFSRNDVFPAVIAASLTQAAQSDLSSHFQVSEAFLAAHTREGIEALLVESGFKSWLEHQSDGAKKWKAIAASKKAVMPSAVMEAGFDWTGFVPRSVATVSPRGFVGI